MAHQSLAEQINAVVEVFSLLLNGIGVVVVIAVVRLADVVDTVESMVDVESHKVTPFLVIQRHRSNIRFLEILFLHTDVVV